MIITSLITEYNPFHNGHIHHIEASKRLTGADITIAIMSGNFTQRGEIAVTDKFKRAKAAIRHVDLVVELPFINAVSFADDFALGGVHIAKLLKSDNIVFGSESGDIAELSRLQSLMEDADIRSSMQTLQKKGYSYPRALAAALQTDVFKGANDILGLSYLKALEKLQSDITPHTIKRIGNDYNDPALSERRFSSATSLRNALWEGNLEGASRFMPAPLAQEIHKDGPLTNEVLFPSLKLLIHRSTPEELRRIYTMTEGLEHRLISRIRRHSTYESFLDDVKTKRYTRTRLNRLMLYILFNLTSTKMEAYSLPQAVRVLAMNKRGQAYLKTLSQDLEIITNVNSTNRHHIQDEITATDVHNIFSGSKRNDYNTPVIIAD